MRDIEHIPTHDLDELIGEKRLEMILISVHPLWDTFQVVECPWHGPIVFYQLPHIFSEFA